MNRGSHQSADEYLGFVEEEMTDFIRKGFWLVLPFAAVQHLPDLRILPLGVVPQRNRRPRLIVDYTFSGVNEETRKMAPGGSMQFGRALDRILLAVLEAPDEFGPTYMCFSSRIQHPAVTSASRADHVCPSSVVRTDLDSTIQSS
jgi:hypothetical protein